MSASVATAAAAAATTASSSSSSSNCPTTVNRPQPQQQYPHFRYNHVLDKIIEIRSKLVRWQEYYYFGVQYGCWSMEVQQEYGDFFQELNNYLATCVFEHCNSIEQQLLELKNELHGSLH